MERGIFDEVLGFDSKGVFLNISEEQNPEDHEKDLSRGGSG
ncbi:MAG: hypothetical protein SNF33_05375 [Candidatus Algichlamydia australiensis]|nr:hypothetical protein [Chlamydiales bacterium]